ncbi:internalin A [Vigna unguiculata]|uniref:Internalin A n=1 Tax=Vigna unguiculata TaxID=3917 RepID=A0A4D6LBB8_VIGUN|nr:internalin A [Vigna unguiculata]
MPVLETLGGALFGAVLQVLFDRIDSRQVVDYFRGRKLDEKLLKKLKRKLVSINAVVDDAEQKQFRNSYVKAWLDEVRDVLLDTEDLMDEIHYEFSTYELEVESQGSSSKVCSFESRIIEVLDDLESLLNQKDDLGLKNASRVEVGFGVDKAKSITKKTRHFSLVIDDEQYSRELHYHGFENLYDAKRLRTFIPVPRITYLHHSFRSCLTEVPETIGDLIHLRSLDLSYTYIQKLPDSMCSLCNLQTLKLNNCVILNELPWNLHKLTNLHHLELMGNRLTKLPMHIGKLNNLEILVSPFNVGKSSEICIQQLGELSVHGDLLIKDLQNTVNPLDALAADLKSKTCLVRLGLHWDFERNLDNSIEEREVLENMKPCRQLEHLSIADYGGTKFPRWLSDNSLSNLVSLSLKNCKHCTWLPSLGLLTFLKHLTIRGLDWIGRIDADFYGNSSSSFPSLETLDISNMKEWEEWKCMTGAFSSLQHLYVTNCPKLKGQLPEHLSHLKKLTIENCQQLVTLIPRTLEICELHLQDCGKLEIDYHPTTLKRLQMQGDNMEMISQENPHRHLKSLTIEKCSQFEYFPNEGLFAPELENLVIVKLEKLKLMPKHMSALLPSLDYMCVWVCPRVELSEGSLPSNLREMRLWNCSKLVASLNGVWGTNHSLKSLYIGKVDVEFFGGEDLLPISLTRLDICHCPNLKKLDCNIFCHLSSLESLELVSCPNLQCLPEEGLPKSVSYLKIKDCLLLTQRCKKEEGQDREKIAHIKFIRLDY